MAKKKTIGILTGGGDVPGLNPAIRAVTLRALKEGYNVIGIRNGWKGVIEINREKPASDQPYCMNLTEEAVSKIARTGGTFLHTSRTKADKVSLVDIPQHLKANYKDEINDLTKDAIKNLEHIGIDYLIPIGGDDTLSYGVRLHKEGMKVVGIPKTMDGDVPGTDYCIGFSTCITRIIELTNALRTSTGSHERILVVEVMGRNAGFSAMLPTIGGAADRCIIPEHAVNIERLTELLIEDRRRNPSNYSICLVSEGAMIEGGAEVFESNEIDAFGHKKLGGIGSRIANEIKLVSSNFNLGQKINVNSQSLGYLVRSGNPDATDSIVPTAYGNIALDLINEDKSGMMVAIRKGLYTAVSIEEVQKDAKGQSIKAVNVEKYYDKERYRPKYSNLIGDPWTIMTGN